MRLVENFQTDAEYLKCGNANLSWHLTPSYDLFSPVFFLSLSLSVCLCLSLSLSVFLLNRDIRTKIQRQQLHTHLMVLGPCGKSNFFSKLKRRMLERAHLLWKCVLTGGDLQLAVPGEGILCANMTLTPAEGVWDQPGFSLSLVSELDV